MQLHICVWKYSVDVSSIKWQIAKLFKKNANHTLCTWISKFKSQISCSAQVFFYTPKQIQPFHSRYWEKAVSNYADHDKSVTESKTRAVENCDWRISVYWQRSGVRGNGQRSNIEAELAHARLMGLDQVHAVLGALFGDARVSHFACFWTRAARFARFLLRSGSGGGSGCGLGHGLFHLRTSRMMRRMQQGETDVTRVIKLSFHVSERESHCKPAAIKLSSDVSWNQL